MYSILVRTWCRLPGGNGGSLHVKFNWNLTKATQIPRRSFYSKCLYRLRTFPLFWPILQICKFYLLRCFCWHNDTSRGAIQNRLSMKSSKPCTKLPLQLRALKNYCNCSLGSRNYSYLQVQNGQNPINELQNYWRKRKKPWGYLVPTQTTNPEICKLDDRTMSMSNWGLKN
jgi:hypothetical protein